MRARRGSAGAVVHADLQREPSLPLPLARRPGAPAARPDRPLPPPVSSLPYRAGRRRRSSEQKSAPFRFCMHARAHRPSAQHGALARYAFRVPRPCMRASARASPGLAIKESFSNGGTRQSTARGGDGKGNHARRPSALRQLPHARAFYSTVRSQPGGVCVRVRVPTAVPRKKQRPATTAVARSAGRVGWKACAGAGGRRERPPHRMRRPEQERQRAEKTSQARAGRRPRAAFLSSKTQRGS